MRPRRPPLDGATAALAMPDARRIVAASVAVALRRGLTQDQAAVRVLTAAQLALARCRDQPGRPPIWLAGVTAVAYQEWRRHGQSAVTPQRSAGGA